MPSKHGFETPEERRTRERKSKEELIVQQARQEQKILNEKKRGNELDQKTIKEGERVTALIDVPIREILEEFAASISESPNIIRHSTKVDKSFGFDYTAYWGVYLRRGFLSFILTYPLVRVDLSVTRPGGEISVYIKVEGEGERLVAEKIQTATGIEAHTTDRSTLWVQER